MVLQCTAVTIEEAGKTYNATISDQRQPDSKQPDSGIVDIGRKSLQGDIDAM